MPRPAEFNESTYAFKVTAEVSQYLTNQQALTAFPFIPTLRAEADLGYDVSIGARWGMIYLQYKIPEYMFGPTAREYGWLNHSYFRFTVKSDETTNGSIQHNVLCALETRETPLGGGVCYVAPIFLTDADFLTYYQTDTVIEQSVFASPLHLGTIARDELHRYTYTSQADVVPFSEPRAERSGSLSSVLSGIREVLAQVEPTLLANYLDRTASTLREIGNLYVEPALPAIQQIAALASALSLQPVLVRYDPSAAAFEAEAAQEFNVT